jgi:enediyne biosynthesis protein E7
MESTLVLALLAQRYELHLLPGRRVETEAVATLRPRYGMWIMAHPR